jgi:hypothetical protein
VPADYGRPQSDAIFNVHDHEVLVLDTPMLKENRPGVLYRVLYPPIRALRAET